MSGIISDNVGRSSGLLKPVAVAVGGATDAEATNIMLNAFRICVAGGLTKQNMVDGVVDEFEDETGIDTANSTTEGYDATSDFYSGFGSSTTNSSASEWTGATGSFTFSGSDVLRNSGSKAIKTVDTFTGDVEINFTMTSYVGTGYMGFYDKAEDSTFNENTGSAGLASMTVVWAIHDDGGGEDTYYGNSKQSDEVIADGSVFKMERVGSVFKVYDDGVVAHTWSQTNSSTELRWGMGSDSGLNFDSMSWTQPGTGAFDFTLLSTATTAATAPTTANVTLWEQDIDASTANTDFLMYVSREAGQTFTTDYGTDEKLDISTHGFLNDDRVMVTSSSQDLPAGSDSAKVYYVVNKTTNDFELSLTSGGSAINITDNGSGTHTARRWTQVTLADEATLTTGRVLTGTATISGQTSGTAMRYAIVTTNTKELKIHAVALQWS